jgi:hypothetical protein
MKFDPVKLGLINDMAEWYKELMSNTATLVYTMPDPYVLQYLLSILFYSNKTGGLKPLKLFIGNIWTVAGDENWNSRMPGTKKTVFTFQEKHGLKSTHKAYTRVTQKLKKMNKERPWASSKMYPLESKNYKKRKRRKDEDDGRGKMTKRRKSKK